MKKVLAILCLMAAPAFAADFVHPMDFKNTEAEKTKVVDFIKAQVRKDYCDSGLDMCDNITLRSMESENLSAFKKATQATNRSIMDKVINDYCESGIDMCNYSTIYMMYVENEKAGSAELEW